MTSSKCEAIVNAANSLLRGGTGVCGAIFKAAGWLEMQLACDRFEIRNGVRCPVGESRITNSFKLNTSGIKYVIHTVGPDCTVIKDIQQQNELLMKAYTNSLILAKQHAIKSIAFPFISTGVYAFPKERAALMALKAIIYFLKSNETKISLIELVLFLKSDFDLLLRVAAENYNDE